VTGIWVSFAATPDLSNSVSTLYTVEMNAVHQKPIPPVSQRGNNSPGMSVDGHSPSRSHFSKMRHASGLATASIVATNPLEGLQHDD
jgi:hypothetical protein